jgi:RimJ/RimL family protein N-acetyltransferase
MSVIVPGESSRLLYERLRSDHAREFYPALTDPQVYEWISGAHPTNLADLAAQFVDLASSSKYQPAGEQFWNLVIRNRETGQALGRIQALIVANSAEIAFVLGRVYWGRGYAAEAVTWLLNELGHSGVFTYWATVAPGNTRSQRLLHRLGFKESPQDLPLLRSYDPGDQVYLKEIHRPRELAIPIA